MLSQFSFKSQLRYLGVVFFACLLLSGSVFAGGMPEPVVVSMHDDYFSPEIITVVSGQKVIWINKGQKAHTVSSSRGEFNSGSMSHGARFEHTFTKPGTYNYYCSFHSFLIFGMRGKVIVN